MLNYSDLTDQVVRDIAKRVGEFSHIDPDRVAIGAAARCSARQTGNLAHCCGLRNDNSPTFSIWTYTGSRRVIAVSQWFQPMVPRVRFQGRTMSYLIQLRLPRILLSNPLETLIHELYHIGEQFDGKMRPVRHGAYFDAQVRRLMRLWLASAKGDLPRLAQMTFKQLTAEFGAIVALSLPPGFKIPYMEAIDPPMSYEAGLAKLYPGHSLAAGHRIREIELNASEPLKSLTEKDLVLRHYDRRGTRRLPALYTRYTRDREALSA